MMKSMSRQADFISGIHTFCDRWCERCQFTERCRVFAELGPSTDDNLESSLQKVSESLAEAKRMLIEKADEMGIDLDAVSDDEFAQIRQREYDFVEGDELSELANRYWRSAKEILDNADSLIPDSVTDDDLLSEAMLVLFWYLFFIPVKVKSGLHGLLDEEGFEDEAQLVDSQSYANGTVKIGLIAIEKSIVAWKQVLGIARIDEIRSVIDLLEGIRTKLDARFPLARDFVRPGFDEAEMVM